MLSQKESVLRGVKLIGIQFALLAVITTIFALWDLDRTIASFFYDPAGKWFLGHQTVWRWLYHYGTLPAILMTLACLIGWLVSFFNSLLVAWRPYFLLVVLTTIIASGFLVNVVFKQHWGRPRPNQIHEFGGLYQYRHIFQPGIPGKGASFPSGHSAMGFTFLSLVFFKRRSKTIAYGGAMAGLLFGGLLSTQRLIRGAHFPTDILWALGIVLMTATALYYCFQRIPATPAAGRKQTLRTGRKAAPVILAALAALLIAGFFMAYRPFFKTSQFQVPLGDHISRMVIRVDADPDKLSIRTENTGKAKVLVHAQGFGWAYVDYAIVHDISTLGDTVTLNLDIDARSYFAELDHAIEVILPAPLADRIFVEVLPWKPSDA